LDADHPANGVLFPCRNTPLEPTEEQRKFVTMAAAVGTPHDDIGTLIGVSANTLRRYFQHELDVGSAQANLRVGINLYRMATGDPSLMSTLLAAIWWSKAMMGWQDPSRIRGINIVGAPVENCGQVVVILQDSDRSDASLAIIPGQALHPA
jgi:hypothetical protein